MLTTSGHLTYCTNIHPGESWPAHFAELEKNFPLIKEKISPNNPMGIGLRLSNEASIELIKEENLFDFKEWLTNQDAYVFTMNGFPYGGFHRTVVKDQVHTPDWTTDDRVNYTIRLFNILAALIPANLDGGISTSPLSYRHWFKSADALALARQASTKNIVIIIENLVQIHRSTGSLLHLDIEPEPDGLLETGEEFLEWFEKDLLPVAVPVIQSKFNVAANEAENLIKEHLRLCYDVCHFAIGYEVHDQIIDKIRKRGIKIGKIQISAALKAKMDTQGDNKKSIKQSFERFNEPTYLHQVLAKTPDGRLLRYPDLTEALSDTDTLFREWRAHFHVPIFLENFGLLSSTQDEITEVLRLQKKEPFTQHLEVETYTWEVLPADLKLPLQDSIIRELNWVKQTLGE